MAKFGYYFETNNQTELVQALQWMSDYGCNAIAKDFIEYENSVHSGSRLSKNLNQVMSWSCIN